MNYDHVDKMQALFDLPDFQIEKGDIEDPGAIVLTKYTGSERHIVVPDGVTKIGMHAFELPEIESVDVPASVREIHSEAFLWNKVKSGIAPDENGFYRIGRFLLEYAGDDDVVVVPEGITDIFDSAFYHAVRKIKFPSSLRTIHSFAFSNNTALEQVEFSPDSTDLDKIESSAFMGCVNLEKFDIPHGCAFKEVEGGAFNGCGKLPVKDDFRLAGNILLGYGGESSTITVPEGVVTIGGQALKWGNSLSTVVLPDSVRYISEGAFAFCSKLQNVELPNSVEIISEEAFTCCSALSMSTLPDKLRILGNGAFNLCKNIKSMELPESLECIGTKMESGDNILLGKIRGSFEETSLTEISIPSSVKRISANAFLNCLKLKKIDMAEGLEAIGENAFGNCRALQGIRIPASVRELKKNIFRGTSINAADIDLPAVTGISDPAYYGLGDENGCVVKDGKLIDYVGSADMVTITEGVTEIQAKDLSHIPCVDIHLPDSLKLLQGDRNSRFGTSVRINLPAEYLQQRKKLPAVLTVELLKCQWKNQATLKDYCYLFLFQTGKELKKLCNDAMGAAPAEAANCIVNILEDKDKAASYSNGADFIFNNKSQIGQETIDIFYQKAKKAKASRAANTVKPLLKCDQESSSDTPQNAESNRIEEFCRQTFSEASLDDVLKKAGIMNTKKWKPVYYKGTQDSAPEFVVKCAFAPYMALMVERPKRIGGFKKDYLKTDFCRDSDRVADELDEISFRDFLRQIVGDVTKKYKECQILLPFCRFGESSDIALVISAMNRWENWSTYKASGRSAIIVTRGALMLSDSREAMLYADKTRCLDYYAEIRGTTADIIRDTQIVDFGLDEKGQRSFDLGNTIIEVSINRDLTFSLYDRNADKAVKSIPKRGADLKKYAEVKTQFADMKRNLKNAVKGHKNELFEEFLNGRVKPAAAWKDSYLTNPLLHRIAELLVWHQDKRTFTLTNSGLIDCEQRPYTFDENCSVGLAHPIEMEPSEITSWQCYFTDKGLKQPFEQVWEPVIAWNSVKPDRYAGLEIPYYRFLHKEQEGITVIDEDFHSMIMIRLADLTSDIERVYYARHNIEMNDPFEIKEIRTRRQSRIANHLIAYFDRITIAGKILNDDFSAIEWLPEFTLSQIMEFIDIAVENHCTNLTGALIEYKNNNFAEFSPVDQLIL